VSRKAAALVAILTIVLPPLAAAQDRAAVEAELERLRRELRIPAMSAAVVESGTTVWVRHLGFKASAGEPVRYPMASLTKPFAAVLAMQLAQRGGLRLDAAAVGAVSARHLLTHTSTGTPGRRFVYSSARFALLQPLLEKAAGQPFATALAARILRPSGLRHTLAPPRATPSEGLESTVEDLARFASAVERGTLLAAASRQEMFRLQRGPTGQALPHALGWFVQYIGGEEVRWHFGQQSESSALLLMIPRRRLTFVLLARTDRLSAPFWLQLGDVRWSPFASVFLTGWGRVRIDLAEARRAMMQAFAAIHAHRGEDARGHVARATVLAPALGDTADGALLAAFARSGHQELRAAGRRIGRRLLAVDAEHPRTLLDLAVLNLQDRQAAEARRLLQQVTGGNAAPPEILRVAADLLKEMEGSGHVEGIP
jgi:CubicO group peptidase (beta-lactamase class C family)